MDPTYYHFSDAEVLKTSIENFRFLIDPHFTEDNPYLRQIEELAAIHLSNTNKTEEEIESTIRSFFLKPATGQGTLPLITLINLHAVDTGFVTRVKTTLIECAKHPLAAIKEQTNSVAALRLKNRYDLSITDLYIAAENGLVEEAKEIIIKDPDSMQTRTTLGNSPLQIAVFKGHSKMVALLLESGADIKGRDNKEYTALDTAVSTSMPCDRTQHLIVKILLEKIKSLNLDLKQVSTTHLLYESCLKNKYSIAALLFEHGVEIKVQGHESLNTVVKKRNIAMIKLLLDNGIPVDPEVKDNQSALQLAIFIDDLKVVKTILKYKPDLTLQDSAGRTPLHFAAIKGNKLIIAKLLKKGADINIKDPQGYTPIEYAAAAQNHSIVAYLRNSGATI